MKRLLATLGCLSLCFGIAPAAVAPHADAAVKMIDKNKGKPGFCPDGKGVTVVVDFQQLGGETLVRCNPTGTRGTGLDALKGAGFQIAGVQRWGESFICRIENRPSAVEPIAVSGTPGYKEQCINTPPGRAYWSYWHAGNNCAWTYSQWGVKNRDFATGGFEGWSFSLNASESTNPKPRIAAVRPGTAGGTCMTKPEKGPTTNDPNEKQPGSVDDNGYVPDPEHGKDGRTSDDPNDPVASRPPSGGGAATTGGGTTSAPGGAGQTPAPNGGQQPGALPGNGQQPGSVDNQQPSQPPGTGGGVASNPSRPAPKPRGDSQVAAADAANLPDDPSKNVAFSGGQDSPDVRDVLKKQANASDFAPWVAVGSMGLLAGLAYLTTKRRARVREDA